MIVGPQLCGGWEHNNSTKTKQTGHANEQSIYSLMYVCKLLLDFLHNRNFSNAEHTSLLHKSMIFTVKCFVELAIVSLDHSHLIKLD
jgi:hypothetical protein